MGGAAGAIVCYAGSSIALSLTNKLLFSDVKFDFPFSVLAFQAGVIVVLYQAASAVGLSDVPFVRQDHSIPLNDSCSLVPNPELYSSVRPSTSPSDRNAETRALFILNRIVPCSNVCCPLQLSSPQCFGRPQKL